MAKPVFKTSQTHQKTNEVQEHNPTFMVIKVYHKLDTNLSDRLLGLQEQYRLMSKLNNTNRMATNSSLLHSRDKAPEGDSLRDDICIAR